MIQALPSFSCRYHLTLDEAKEGFALATFGKNRFSRFITPVISVLIIIWGISLGMDGVGKFYLILGLTFLLLQIFMRLVFLPKMFTRQYLRHRFGELEQGIDLYQQYAVLWADQRQQQVEYSEISKFIVGKKSYMLELQDKTVIIISKQAIYQSGQQEFFESAIQRV